MYSWEIEKWINNRKEIDLQEFYAAVGDTSPQIVFMKADNNIFNCRTNDGIEFHFRIKKRET